MGWWAAAHAPADGVSDGVAVGDADGTLDGVAVVGLKEGCDVGAGVMSYCSVNVAELLTSEDCTLEMYCVGVASGKHVD
jgi:hypothetical protein